MRSPRVVTSVPRIGLGLLAIALAADLHKAAAKAPGKVGEILRAAKPTVKGDTVSVVYIATAEQASALTFEF